MTALGGFFLAADGRIDWLRLLLLLIGTALIIGGSCALNNVYDRDIDASMQRTKKRPIVTGVIPPRRAVIFGLGLAAVGTVLLLWKVNWLTAALGLFGMLTYAGLYTVAKHRTPYATLLGTIPGAVPPVAGYTAVTGRLDLACLLLFGILITWQMPHFYAIAIRRLDEYKAAKVPVWPAVYGIRGTQLQMLWFTAAFIVLVERLSLSGYTGVVFAAVMGCYGLYWFYVMLKGAATTDPTAWAKSVFLLSLPALPLLAVLLAANHWLP